MVVQVFTYILYNLCKSDVINVICHSVALILRSALMESIGFSNMI